jgi:hypothetical protein
MEGSTKVSTTLDSVDLGNVARQSLHGRQRPLFRFAAITDSGYLPFLTVCLYVVLGLFFTVLDLTNSPVLALLLTLLPAIDLTPSQRSAMPTHLGHTTYRNATIVDVIK